MCMRCSDRGVTELDPSQVPIDDIHIRYLTLCTCVGKACWWRGMANGCRPIPDYPRRNDMRRLAMRLVEKHRAALQALKDYGD